MNGLIFIAQPVTADTPSTAKQTHNLSINVYIKHVELAAEGETGIPIIIGETEDSILLTDPDIVAGVEKLAEAEEIRQAILLDIAEGLI